MSCRSRSKEVTDRAGAVADVKGRGERGDTLIEVLLALFVLGLTALALMLAFGTSISASQRHREIASANIVLGSASQQALSQIEQNTNLFGCSYAVTAAAFVGGGVNFTIPTQVYGGSTAYTAEISNVEYWNGTQGEFVPGCISGNVPMEVTVQVTSFGESYTNNFVVDLPSGDLGIGPDLSNGNPSQLVFGGVQGETASGSSGAAFSPQPVVSVLDINNEVVQSDLSPIQLSIEGNPADATIGCGGANDPDGIATYTGCTITGPAGTYIVHATFVCPQGQPCLDSDPSGANLNENSVNALGSSFWESPTVGPWYGTTFAVTIASAPDKVVFAPAPVAGASGAALTTMPTIKIETAAGVVDTTQNGTLTLSLTGGSLVNCLSATGAVNTTNGGEYITVPVLAGQVSLTGCQFSGAIFWNQTASPPGPDATKYTITASYTNSAPASNLIFVTAAGSPTQLVFSTQPSGVSSTTSAAAPWPSPFAVEVEDAFGNPAYSLTGLTAAVTAKFDTADAVAETLNNCAKSSVADSGIVVFSNCEGTAYGGGLKLTATYTTYTVNSTAFSISSDAASLEFTTQPEAGPSGSALSTQPVIEILDGQGDVDTGWSGSITLTASGGSLTGCTGLTPNNGVVNVGTCLFAGDAGTPYTLTAGLTNAVGTPITGTSAQFTPSQAGAATQLVFTTQPVAGATAGSLMTTQPVVKVEDSQGNVVTNSTATLNQPTSSSGSTLTGCTNLTAVAGVVNVSGCMFGGQVGSYYTMTVTSSGLGSATSELFASNTSAGTEDGVQISAAPTAASVSDVTNVQLTFEIVDAYGNETVSNGPTNLTVSSTSSEGFFNINSGDFGTVGDSTTLTIPSGSSTGTVYYGDEAAGVPTIFAYNSVLQQAFGSTTLTIDPDTATQLVFGTAPPTTTTASSEFSVAVWDEDQYGNVVTTDNSTSVSLSATNGSSDGGFTCSSTTEVVSSGVATFSNCYYSSASATPYTLTASAAGLGSATASTTVSGGAASKMAIWGGNDQSAQTGASFASPLSVLVTDSSGNPVSGVTVTFTSLNAAKSGTLLATGGACVATGGTTVYTCTAVTNAQGIASSLSFTAGATAGTYHVIATSTGLPTALFSETNAGGALVFLSAPQTFTTTSGPIVIQSQDGNGNPVVQSSNLTVTIGYAYTGGVTLSTGPTTEVIPAGSSSVSFTVTAGATTTGGTVAITGSATSNTTTPTQTETVRANNGTGTIVTPTSPQTAASGGSVPNPGYPVKITNSSTTATLYYKVIAVNGLGQTEAVSGCSTGIRNTSTTIDETVAVPTTQASGTYMLTFLVESYTNAACTVAGAYFQGNGTLNVTAGAAANIAVNGGYGQSTTAGTSFSAPLTAVVTDGGGNLVAGVVVTFTSPTGGAGGTFLAAANGGTCLATGGVAVSSCTATTNINGVASSLTFTANAVSGSYSVSATATGVTGSAAFEEENQ